MISLEDKSMFPIVTVGVSSLKSGIKVIGAAYQNGKTLANILKIILKIVHIWVPPLKEEENKYDLIFVDGDTFDVAGYILTHW